MLHVHDVALVWLKHVLKLFYFQCLKFVWRGTENSLQHCCNSDLYHKGNIRLLLGTSMFYSVGNVLPVVMLRFEQRRRNYPLCWNSLNSFLLSFGDLQLHRLRQCPAPSSWTHLGLQILWQRWPWSSIHSVRTEIRHFSFSYVNFQGYFIF